MSALAQAGRGHACTLAFLGADLQPYALHLLQAQASGCEHGSSWVHAALQLAANTHKSVFCNHSISAGLTSAPLVGAKEWFKLELSVDKVHPSCHHLCLPVQAGLWCSCSEPP